MKKHLVLLFGLLLAFLFVMPSIAVAVGDIEYGPPDIVVGYINVDDVLMVIVSQTAEKGALSFDMYQLQSCSGHHLKDIGQHVQIGFNSGTLAMCGHLGGVHSSPFG